MRANGELLSKVAAGDREAFKDLCVSVLPPLVRFAKRKCFQMHIAQDLADDFVQEAVLKAINWLEAQTDKSKQVHRGWLRTIVANTMNDWVRRERFNQFVPTDQLEDQRAGRPRDVPDETDEVLEAYRQLSATDQAILQLVLVEGRKTKEAARQLGISEWATYKRYERALKRLRDQIPKSP